MLKPPEPAEALAESPFKGKTGLIRIVHAFFNSLAGLKDAWRHESAFRQEILLAAILVPVAFIVHVSAVERALLVALRAAGADRGAPQHRASRSRSTGSPSTITRSRKRAKDIGSAAVFVALVLCVVWALVLPVR